MLRPASLGGEQPGTPEEQALYMNLCILQVSEAASKHGLELVRTSFRKPNPKALELVLYHLYAAVVGEAKAAKEFRNIWPVQGNQSKEFNQKISDWFKELKEKHQLENLTSMSQLRSATGHRIVTTLLDISTLAMSMELARMPREPGAPAWSMKVPAEKDPKLLAELGGMLTSLAAVGVFNQAQEFVGRMQRAAEAQEAYEQYASELTKQYYGLKSACEALERTHGAGAITSITQSLITPEQLAPSAEGDEVASAAATTSLFPDVLQPTAQMEQAGTLMAQLGSHLESYAPLSQMMSQAVGSAVHPYAIDGALLSKLLSQPLCGSSDGAGEGADVSLPAVGRAYSDGAAHVQGVDVGAVLDEWVDKLEACSPAITALTSGPNGASPLVAAPSDSTSHAALLTTQLRVHRAAVDKLEGMKQTLAVQMQQTDTRLREVQPVILAAMARHQDLPATLLPGAHLAAASTHPLRGSTPGMPGAGAVRASPTAGGQAWAQKLLSTSVETVPPTPLLLQHAQAAAAARMARHAAMGISGQGVRGSGQAGGSGLGLFGAMQRGTSLDPASGATLRSSGGGAAVPAAGGIVSYGGSQMQRRQVTRASADTLPAKRPAASVNSWSSVAPPSVTQEVGQVVSEGPVGMDMSPAPALFGHSQQREPATGAAGLPGQVAVEAIMGSPVDIDMMAVDNGGLFSLDGAGGDDLLMPEDQDEWGGLGGGPRNEQQQQQPILISTFKTMATVQQERQHQQHAYEARVAAAMNTAKGLPTGAGIMQGTAEAAAGAGAGVTLQSLGLGVTPQPTPDPFPNRKLSYSAADPIPMISPLG